MGQAEVLIFLEEEHKKNGDKWFSIDEVKEQLNNRLLNAGNVWQQVNKLCASNRVFTKLERLDACRWGYKRVIKHKGGD